MTMPNTPPDRPGKRRNEQGAAKQGGRTATAVREKPAPTPVDALPPYRVILHNDNTNDMVHVVESIVMLTPHSRHTAVELMLRAHTRGRAKLLDTHRERAELYVEQFRSRRLTVTMERGG
ncbi:MAG: ATP-dependent Clp protease adaptor ClpS [Phycisphaeraceae bacterium]|nr:MAG: ATP-dependent Clp protease adaptor ClpS [Phycisphaeraceae bacterium]